MSGSNFCCLICLKVSQEAAKVVWYSHLFKNVPQFAVIHTIKCFSIVNEAEVYVFLEFHFFLCDPTNFGNLIFDCSASLNLSLYMWKFLVHILSKLSLKDFEYYLGCMWNECNCMAVWIFWGIAFLWDWKTELFQSCGHCWVFQIHWHIECRTLIASSFRIWKSSAGIPSLPLSLYWDFLRPPWLHTSGCWALGE